MKKRKSRKTSEPQTKHEHLKNSIIKTRNTIKKKFQNLHNSKLAINEKVTETYKPIIEPLEKLVKREKVKRDEEEELIKLQKKTEPKTEYVYLPGSVFKTAVAPHRENPFKPTPVVESSQRPGHDISGVSPMFEDAMEGDSLEDNIINKIRSGTDSPHLDTKYGFKYKRGELMLGKEKVAVKTTKSKPTYLIGKKLFPATPGVTDLLLSDNPQNYSEDDLKTYKNMLVHTSAHRQNFNKFNEVNRDKSDPKYTKIISRLFPTSQRKLHQKKGASLNKPQTKYKTMNRKGADDGFNYVYWDDPNELIDRLRLLMASQTAGHTGHDNEIISIIEELREAKIIK